MFAALFAYLLSGEALSARQLLGCALILAGMVVAEGFFCGRTCGMLPREKSTGSRGD